MNAEFFAAVADIEKEKGIPKEYMYEKITQALLAAFRKDNPEYAENVLVEMVKKERSPFWVALGDAKMEHYLNRKKFEAAEAGWYYSQSKRAVLVKYPNPKKETMLTVSFEDFDLIGM